jgi:hypothetical protein
VRYLVSDRAKALIQLADQGLECLSMPAFFHVMHDLVKRYSLAIARRGRHAHQECKKAEEVLNKPLRLEGHHQASLAVHPQVEMWRAEVQRWEGVHSTSRHYLDMLSLTLHPFHIDDSTPQTSAQVHSRLEAEVTAIATLAQDHQFPVQHDAMKKVRKQLPALAARVDFWREGVRQD